MGAAQTKSKKKKKKKKGGGQYNGLLIHFICRVNYDRVSMFTWVWDHGYRYDYNAMGVGTGTSLAFSQEVTGTDLRPGPWVQVQTFVSG